MSVSVNRRRFSVVPRRRQNRWLAVIVVILWLLSLGLVWLQSARQAAPTLAAVAAERDTLREEQKNLESDLTDARQQIANLGRSEEIARAANLNLQRTLSEREEEMAQLRADVSFYERLVGTSGQRRGLSVHSLEFSQGADRVWSYQVTLVQNLNRGKISRGDLTLAIEGVLDGTLDTLEWTDLKQESDSQPQPFEFRYFQQLRGNVMLPPNFQPHRVRVSLRTEGRELEQPFDWDRILTTTASAGR